MKQVELIQNNLNDFLLRDVIFFIKNDRVVKKGKLILFKFKEFHFVFTIENDKNEHKTYEVPYPFNWNRENRDSLEFSYNLDDFTLVNSNLYYRMKVLDNSNSGKLYNSYLVLSAL